MLCQQKTHFGLAPFLPYASALVWAHFLKAQCRKSPGISRKGLSRSRRPGRELRHPAPLSAAPTDVFARLPQPTGTLCVTATSVKPSSARGFFFASNGRWYSDWGGKKSQNVAFVWGMMLSPMSRILRQLHVRFKFVQMGESEISYLLDMQEMILQIKDK